MILLICMVNATLCTTNSDEPWAANVDFSVMSNSWSTQLDVKYQHYKNLCTNNHVVIVYKVLNLELIMKGVAKLTSIKDGRSLASITVTWLRLVENSTVSDFDSVDDITQLFITKQLD